jgi:hypothetical protein
MSLTALIICVLTAATFIGAGCTQKPSPSSVVKHFPIDSTESVITRSGIQMDKGISTDGNGSLRIDSSGSTVVRLYEVNTVDVEDARLTYQARLRTEGVDGEVYLEMWCGFTGEGEFFSRGLQSPVTGTTEWTTVETPFFLEKGQNPDIVKLNLVIDGKGTVWIDDVRLLKGPLK